MEVAKNFDETFNKLIKFLESENFQTSINRADG